MAGEVGCSAVITRGALLAKQPLVALAAVAWLGQVAVAQAVSADRSMPVTQTLWKQHKHSPVYNIYQCTAETFMCVCVCVYVYMCACVCVCMCVHICVCYELRIVLFVTVSIPYQQSLSSLLLLS